MSCPGTGSIPLSMAPDAVWQAGGEWLVSSPDPFLYPSPFYCTCAKRARRKGSGDETSEWLGVFAGCGLKHGGRAFMSLQL